MLQTLHAKLARRLARHCGLQFFRLFSRPLDPQRRREPSAGLRLRLLPQPEVLELCADPELDLRPDGVAAAYARGDLCVAACDSEHLAGYSWIAFAPLPHLAGAWVRFGPRVAWIHKSFVRAAYRGRGIAAALYRFADAECIEHGRDRSVVCVESHNRPSIRAALRAGYAASGWCGYLLRGSGLRSWASAAARRHRTAFFLPASAAMQPLELQLQQPPQVGDALVRIRLRRGDPPA